MLPVTDSIFTSVTPVQWRSTIFGAKFVVALGVSATGIPLVAMIFDRTGSFDLLFTVLALVAALVVLSVALLPIGNAPVSQPAPEASGGA